MTTPTVPRIRLRTPSDVVAAVPYLLGFHPSDSIVTLGVRNGRLTFHTRGDLPDAEAPPGEVDELTRYLADLFEAHGVQEVLLVAYGERRRTTPVLIATGMALSARAIRVLDALVVHDGRFWSQVCDDPACCPPEGTAFDVETTEVAASATFAGREVLPDRDALVGSLGPPRGDELRAIRRATDAAQRRAAELFTADHSSDAVARPLVRVTAAAVAAIDAAVAAYGQGGRIDDDALAWLSVLLVVHEFRDVAWRRIDRDASRARAATGAGACEGSGHGVDDGEGSGDQGGSGDERSGSEGSGEGVEAHRRLWSDVVRRCDPMLVAPPAMLLAYTLWRDGDGVRAMIAIERALAADPEYSAARLMAEVLMRGVPPEALDRMRSGASGRSKKSGGQVSPDRQPTRDRRPPPGARPSRR